MPKFTFICEDDPMPFSEGVVTKRTIEFEAVQISDVVAEFELFLRGAGFNPQGVLDFIDESYYYGEPYTGDGHDGMGSTLEDYPEIKAELENHSHHYFDTERNK